MTSDELKQIKVERDIDLTTAESMFVQENIDFPICRIFFIVYTSIIKNPEYSTMDVLKLLITEIRNEMEKRRA